MPQGLQVFDANGVLIIDFNDRLGLSLGSVDTGVVSGSINVPQFAEGTPWWHGVPIGIDVQTMLGYYPTISISGTTLSWSFSSSQQQRTIITYGVW